MPEASDWKGIVQASWEKMRGKVSAELPKAVIGKGLSNQVYNDELRVCATLNGPNQGAGVWNDDGPGAIEFTSLKVSDFSSVSAGPAKFDNLTVQLPVSSALIAASGRYGYIQPCGYFSFGKKQMSSKLYGAGEITAKSEAGTLTYLLKVIDPDKDLRLELTGASVDGRRSVTVKPDGTPDNPVLRWLVDALGRGMEKQLLVRSALDHFFASDQFSRDMVNELNKIIHTALAERAQR